MSQPQHISSPTDFHIRPATHKDIPSMVDVFYHSFNAPFWRCLSPDTPFHRKWWEESMALSLNNPTDRSFVVEDVHNHHRIVAFSRWMLPQNDGNLERKWPELNEEEFDMGLCGAFFGGMEENREELMGDRPHYMIEMLGTHEDYQRRGIGASLLKWGTDQADAEGRETYLDGSAKAQPYYKARHGFVPRKQVPIPDREAFGSYEYVSMVRPPQ